MKKLITLLAITFCVQSAMATTPEQQEEALKQLEVARAEINAVKSLIPDFLMNSIGKNLENADKRIAYAQAVLGATKVGSSSFYCTVDSSFDGQFAGRGATQIEATNNALKACKADSRGNGFFCNKESVSCQQEQ